MSLKTVDGHKDKGPGALKIVRIAQPGARRCEGCCICHYLPLTNSIKPSLLFSIFGCCISKGSPYHFYRQNLLQLGVVRSTIAVAVIPVRNTITAADGAVHKRTDTG